MSNTFLKDTNNYMLVVGESAHSESPVNTKLYQIINKETDVIEVETSVMYRAIMALQELQNKLDLVNSDGGFKALMSDVFSPEDFEDELDVFDMMETLQDDDGPAH